MSQKLHTMDITDKVISIKFADNRIPDFKEIKGTDYIKFGDDDRFPDHTLMLYNKSAKHNAIIIGKANYIIGNGLQTENEQAAEWAKKVNRYNETLQEVGQKFILDCEIFGGFYVEELWDNAGRSQ